MIKFFKNQDIQLSSFAVSKEKTANTIYPRLLLGNDENNDFLIKIEVEDCNRNLNAKNSSSFSKILNNYCDASQINNSGYLAATPLDFENNPKFQIGKHIPSDVVFYSKDNPNYDSKINPINGDGTYQGQIYNTIKNMYYNNYNNSYNIFGLDDFNRSEIDLNLEKKIIVYTLNVTQSGDKLRQNSIKINNQTGDIVAYIQDDGNYNLYLSGSYFINNYEFYTTNQNNIINYGVEGLGKYIINN